MNKKLLLVSFDYRPKLGGVATCAFELASALTRQGLSVRVIAPQMKGASEFDLNSPFETHRVDLPTSAFRSVLIFKKAINQAIKSFRPDMLLCLLWMPDGVATYFSSKNTIPYFQIVHGVEVIESASSIRKILRSLLSPLKRTVLKSATEVFCVSRFTKNLVTRYCQLDDQKLQVVFNGANPNLFHPQEKNQMLLTKHHIENQMVFYTIARLEDYKGIDMAIEAFAQIKRTHPNFKYLIGGIGPYRSHLEHLIQKHQLEQQIELIGKIPNDQLIDYYNLCDVFITLSRDDFKTPNVEGFGLVFLEAALCMKPSIGGNSGGINDAIIDGQTGWLVAPISISAITQTFISVIDNQTEVIRRGRLAYERVKSSMTWDHMADKIIERFKTHVRN